MICPFCLKKIPDASPQCPKCLAGQAPEFLPPYAGIFQRILALILDGLISLVVAAPFLAVMFLVQPENPLLVTLPFAAVMGILGLVQLILLFSAGQTLGKKLTGIKIVRADYRPAGFGTLLLRETVGRFVCGLTFGIGYLIALFNPQRAGLHDKIAKTVVVRKLRPNEVAWAPSPQPAQEAYPPGVQEAAPAEIPAFVPDPLPAAAPTVPHPVPPVPAAAPARAVPAPPAPARGAQPPVCGGCGSPVEDESSKFCLVCGYPVGGGVRSFTRFCPKCKSPVADTASTCPTCGQAQAPAPPPLPTLSEAPPPEAEATVVVTTPRLIAYTSDGQQEVLHLQLPLTRIGRNKDNHISFPQEKSVSSHHCEIYLEGTQFYIRDLHSTNGVFVNNRKVDVSPISDGDKLKLGFKILRFSQS